MLVDTKAVRPKSLWMVESPRLATVQMMTFLPHAHRLSSDGTADLFEEIPTPFRRLHRNGVPRPPRNRGSSSSCRPLETWASACQWSRSPSSCRRGPPPGRRTRRLLCRPCLFLSPKSETALKNVFVLPLPRVICISSSTMMPTIWRKLVNLAGFFSVLSQSIWASMPSAMKKGFPNHFWHAMIIARQPGVSFWFCIWLNRKSNPANSAWDGLWPQSCPATRKTVRLLNDGLAGAMTTAARHRFLTSPLHGERQFSRLQAGVFSGHPLYSMAWGGSCRFPCLEWFGAVPSGKKPSRDIVLELNSAYVGFRSLPGSPAAQDGAIPIPLDCPLH